MGDKEKGESNEKKDSKKDLCRFVNSHIAGNGYCWEYGYGCSSR